MAAKIDQKSYLQKYLGGPKVEKKKKKKKVVKGNGLKIIDHDLDLSKLRSLDGDELDILDQGEDAPQIAGIIDERPEEVKRLEQSSKWRVINQDDGFNSNIQIEEIKKDVKEKEKENELIFGKMYSDSEDEKKNDSDMSPPRKQTVNISKSDRKESKRQQNQSDSDLSPPRNNGRNSPQNASNRKKNYDSDLSPPRKHSENNSNSKRKKPSRWGTFEEEKNTLHGNSKRKKSVDASPLRNAQKKRHHLDKSYKNSNHKSRSSDSDSSSHHKYEASNRKKERRRKYDKSRDNSPDSDMSPPRKRNGSPSRSSYHKNKSDRIQKSNSDLSPPTKNKTAQRANRESFDNRKRRQDSDSDMSPPRKEKHRRNDDSPPPSNKRMAKTLEGKLAGLQDAVQLRQENEAFRRREEEAFKKMTDVVSGRNAKAVSRKSKRETSEERQKQKEKTERQKEIDEKYKKWNKGLKQIEDHESRVQDFIHEASKPLARHKDDRDLEDRLKQIERDGDPMLRYLKEKKRERGELGPEKPMYKGNFPPNRFNIRPGYRWDGVDRSNGYEKKYFEQQSKRKAQQEEVYKWSTEDL